MTEQPEWRLGNPPESEEEEEVEADRDGGDNPPVEDRSQAVGGQYSQANHQAIQGQESSSPLVRACDILRCK